MDELYVGKKCPFCNCGFTDEDDIVVCSECEMPHHKECWIENQGCSTYGCNGTIQSSGCVAAQPSTDSQLNTCPNCGRLMEEGAQFCGGCGNRVAIIPPPAPAQPRFCAHCGKKIENDALFCVGCGNRVAPTQPAVSSTPNQIITPQFGQPFLANSQGGYQGGAGILGDFDRDAFSNRYISILCYLGILVLIPILQQSKSPFVRFHANQGIACSIIATVSLVFRYFPIIGFFGNMGLILSCVLAIIGIVNCTKMQKKELPIIGKIKILK